MKSLLADVSAFHRACGQPVLETPQWPLQDRIELRLRLIREEWKELQSAVDANDLVETADALADIIYVCVGTALELGIPLDEVWPEVQRSNMAKAVLQLDGSYRCVVREDGKVLKGPDWQPPDIAAVLAGAGAKQ